MRTLVEIKDNIAVDFMNNEAAAAHYGFKIGDNFSDHFRPTSIESIFFSIFACAVLILEGMFNKHKTEVDNMIGQMRPHRPVWYMNKTLSFMKDMTLIPDTDIYDTTNMTDAEIAAAKVVKHSVARESDDISLLTIKVAGETNGVKGKLSQELEKQLTAYHDEIKDTGVKIILVNRDPDIYNCELDIYYDPILLSSEVEKNCRNAIINYVETLDFNGEYTNVELVDKLQAVAGVKLPHLINATTSSLSSGALMTIVARHTPVAGYFKADNITLNMKAYE